MTSKIEWEKQHLLEMLDDIQHLKRLQEALVKVEKECLSKIEFSATLQQELQEEMKRRLEVADKKVVEIKDSGRERLIYTYLSTAGGMLWCRKEQLHCLESSSTSLSVFKVPQGKLEQRRKQTK